MIVVSGCVEAAPARIRNQGFHSLNTMHDLRRGIYCSHGRFDRIGLARLVAAVEKDDLSALQARQRLAQGSSREDPVGSQRLSAIDHHNVEITMKISMLKTVVQNENRIGSLLEDPFACGPPVFGYS